jgi:hypothetical protein
MAALKNGCVFMEEGFVVTLQVNMYLHKKRGGALHPLKFKKNDGFHLALC